MKNSNETKATPKAEEPLAYYEQIMPIEILRIHKNKDERMKLIVKAVNNHELLIDALKKAAAVLGKLAESNSFTDESYEAYVSVKHALNEAQ